MVCAPVGAVGITVTVQLTVPGGFEPCASMQVLMLSELLGLLLSLNDTVPAGFDGVPGPVSATVTVKLAVPPIAALALSGASVVVVVREGGATGLTVSVRGGAAPGKYRESPLYDAPMVCTPAVNVMTGLWAEAVPQMAPKEIHGGRSKKTGAGEPKGLLSTENWTVPVGRGVPGGTGVANGPVAGLTNCGLTRKSVNVNGCPATTEEVELSA